MTINKGLSFGGGTLRIASVTSRSASTYTAGSAEPQTKAELVIEGAKVADQSVTVGPDGVHASGQAVPVLVGQGSDTPNKALAQAGLTVRTVASQGVESGAASQVLEVTVKHPVPGTGNAQGTLVYQIGSSSSYLALSDDGGAALPVAEPGLGSELPGVEPAAAFEPPPSPPTSGGVPSLEAALSAPGFDGTGDGLGEDLVSFGPALGAFPAAGIAGSGTGVTAPVTGETPLGTVAPADGALIGDFRSAARPLFLILVAGGALLMASSALWRNKGVRASWTP